MNKMTAPSLQSFFIVIVATCGAYRINTTSSAALECRVFQENGKNIYGFIRKHPPLLQLPCYGENGTFNCEGFYGSDKAHCEKRCCAKAKKDFSDKVMKIECKEFTFKGRKIRGFSRKTPPTMELPCYESDVIGTFNCLTLWEPERSFCNSTCCSGSSKVEKENEREVNERIGRGDHSGYPRNNSDEDSEDWKIATYTFMGVCAFFIFLCIYLSVIACKYYKKFNESKRICNPTDGTDYIPMNKLLT